MAKNTPKKSTKSASKFVTKSGKTIRLKRNLYERWQAHRDKKMARKAEILRSLPKSRLKRIVYRLHPKRLSRYWFSKEGGIMALKMLGIGIVAIFMLLLGVFAYFRKDLPDITDIAGKNIGGSILYYDRTGSTLLWEDHDGAKRIPVQSDQIAQVMKDATVAVEDRDFYKHGGFDLKGIMRAGLANLMGGKTSQGGSTITQQLVKLTNLWTDNRTYTRKIKELILSVELERTYTKDQILTGYLNAAPYGGTENGVEAAALDYFRKSAKDLTLDEAAFLAAIPKSPNHYSYYSASFDQTDLLARKNYILNEMYNTGKITKAKRDEAKKADVLAKVQERPSRYDGIKAPYFVLTVKEALENKYSDKIIKQGGWKVTTTLDLNVQVAAEEQVNKGMAQIRRQGGDTAAFVAEDVPTGQVVALVGGQEFTDPNSNHGQNNYARLALPPGSSFKAYDYAALIEHTTNVGAGSVLYDTQGPLEGYPCTNKAQPRSDGKGGNCLWDYDRRYPGPLTLRYAIGGSRNVPAVKAMLTAGIDKTIQTAEKLTEPQDGRDGFGYKCYKSGSTLFTKDNETQCGASSAIGDGAYIKLDEHVHGYASLARNGVNMPQTYIMKITDANNNTIEEWKPSAGKQEIRADSAYIISDITGDPNASYFPSSNKPQRFTNKLGTWKFSVKTGTTNDNKDGWMLGFSTKYAAGIWVGYHDRSVAMSGAMETMTQPIWSGFMRSVHGSMTPSEQPKPSSVQTLPAFVVTSHVGYGSIEPSPSTDLYPSWYKPKAIQTGQKKTIDVVSNKLATECTPDMAKKELTTGTADSYSADKFTGTGGANTEQNDDIHQCTDARPTISIASAPSSCSDTCTIYVNVNGGTHPLDSADRRGTVNVIVDGGLAQSFQVSSAGNNIPLTFNITGSGNHSINAQVIDSVLFDSLSDTTTINFLGSGSPVSITSPSSGQRVGLASSVTVTWTGGAPNFSVSYKTGANPYSDVGGCQNISAQSCNVPLSSGSGQQIRVSDSESDSDTVSFFRP